MMVLRESYAPHRSHRPGRPPGPLSIAGHGRASPRTRPQPAHGRSAAIRRSGTAESSLSPRLWMHASLASIRCSWCGPPRRPLSVPLCSGSRSTHGASYHRCVRSAVGVHPPRMIGFLPLVSPPPAPKLRARPSSGLTIRSRCPSSNSEWSQARSDWDRP
jgi:hypothetical protein